jgi:hypothetical protein
MMIMTKTTSRIVAIREPMMLHSRDPGVSGFCLLRYRPRAS